MLRLMIVDDERAIREAIRSSIDWEKLGITVTGLYKNGVEAYDAILDEYPDIVLTDIKMPGLNGLELISRVVDAKLDTQFVILSGYAEFEFAKQAMRYGVRHYLLKPSNLQQIVDIMTEVREDCYQRRRLSALEKRRSPLLINMRQTFMRGMITEALSDNAPLSAVIERNGQFLDVTNVNYELCYFYFLESGSVDAFLTRIDEVRREYAEGVAIHLIYVNLALILFFESYTADYTTLDAALSALPTPGQKTETEYKRESFQSITSLFHNLIPKLMRFDTVTLLSGGRSVKLNNFSRLMKSSDNLVMELAQTGPDDCGQVLEKINRLIDSTCDIQFLRLMASGMLIKYASLVGNGHTGITDVDFEREGDAASVRKALLDSLYALTSAKTAAKATGEPEFILQIKRYVNDNLSHSELSLKWLAENRLYMNVDYLSKQFALKTGEKFSAYLSRMRIERAKELLSETGAGHIYDVAAQVGCGNNPQYFSQIFKRAVGITPSEFIAASAGKR